ncbi:hypothetical protein [Labilibaculum euxinus]
MATTDKTTLKNWFKNKLKPVQEQFWAWMDSYWHKDEQIPTTSIQGLDDMLANAATTEEFSNLESTVTTAIANKVDKVDGKQLSVEDFTTLLKQKLDGIDMSVKLDRDTYEGTAADLYNYIQIINGNVPEAGNSLEKVYNIITGITNADKEYVDIASRDADKANLDNGESVIVTNAQADPTVTNGWAIYRYNESTETFLKIAEQESIDVDLSNYMKFADLVTQYLDEPNKPAAASLVKALKDIVDGLPHSEADLDHDQLNGFYKFQHLEPGRNLYSDGYSLNAFQGIASGFMNFGLVPLTKLAFNVFVEENPASTTSDYVHWELLNEDGTRRGSNQELVYIHDDGGTKKSINIGFSQGYKLDYGDKYAVLRLFISALYPDGLITGYGCTQEELTTYTEIFSRGMMPDGYQKIEDEYSIVLAVAYLPDSQNTKPEDVQVWNFTEIQHPNSNGLNLDWYGVEWDSSSSLPDCKRIGNLGYHRTLPIQSKIKRCLLWDNGTVHYYLDADDSTKKADGTPSVLDGSHGQVMAEVPEFYYNHELDGTRHRYKISDRPIAGYKKIKKFYISAYEATLQRSTNKLCSLINTDPDYRGGNNTSSWDGTGKTLCGKPVTNVTRNEVRIAATARGAKWHQQTAYEHYMLSMLFVIEYATFNSQSGINYVLDANGFRQGGLGEGATTASSAEWSAYNSYNPVIPAGTMNFFGNKSGQMLVSVADFGGTGIERTFHSNSYRGIENPFGHIWKFIDGLNVNEFVAYATDDVSSLADDSISGYEMVGLMPNTNGYQKDVQNHLLPLPKTVGGDAYSWLCDYYYQASGWRVARVGGHLSNGSSAGLFYLYVNDSSAYRNASIGARLCLRNE